MKRRILYLEHNTDGTVGGSHLCLLEICRYIDRKQYQPVVVFFEKNSLWQDFESAGAEVTLGIPPSPWQYPASLPRWIGRPLGVAINLYRTLIERMFYWKKLLRDLNIHLVHINNACGFDHDLMLACRLSGIPCVVHERGIQSKITLRTRYFANHADRLIAISDAVADNLRNQGIDASQIMRINDSIDPKRLAQKETPESVRARFGIKAGSPVIGIVGNIKPWKGQHVVMRALGYLLHQFPDLHCLFVGSLSDEEYVEEICRYAQSAGIPQSSYTLTGYEACPADLIRTMDIVIHASIEPEPFGIVLLEAMALAKPLIASDDGAPREIILNGKTGLLVPPGDSRILAESVTQLLSDPELADRIAAAGYERLNSKYTVDIARADIESLYDSFLRNSVSS